MAAVTGSVWGTGFLDNLWVEVKDVTYENGSAWRIAAVLAVLSSPPVAARQILIPFASGGITAAATADRDEPRRPSNAERPALIRISERVRAAPASFLTMVHLRKANARHSPAVRVTRNDPYRST
jgi:hypothetical protein